MQLGRRKFLWASGAVSLGAATAGSAWLTFSQRRSARWLRQMARDGRRSIRPAPVKPDPRAWPENALTVCWLGHATVLIQFYGLRILVDPVLHDRVGIDAGLLTLGPKRHVAPALTFEALPAIDVVLLTHAHMDHLDLPTLGRFREPVATVTARDTVDLLAGTKLQGAVALGWGETTRHRSPKGELLVRAFEVQHWGQRWPSEKPRGYNGYLLTREGRSILIGGDTAHTPHFAGLRPHGPFEVAIMPIAAYNPWIRNHCTPEQAVVMADQAGARLFVPVHHDTFKLSEEPLTEPLERLERVLAPEQGRLALRRVGEHVTVA